MLEKIKNLKNKIKENYKVARAFFKKAYNKHIIYLYVVTSLLINLFLEMCARHSFMEGIYFLIGSPYVFICNSLIILITLSVTLLMRRRIFGISLISFIWIVLGISNSVLLANRVTPFTATDLAMIDNALGVVNKYFSSFQVGFVILFSEFFT